MMGCFHSKENGLRTIDSIEYEHDNQNSSFSKKQVAAQQQQQSVEIKEDKIIDVDSLMRFRCQDRTISPVPKLTACGMKHIGFGPLKRENQDMFVVQMEEMGMHKGSLFAVFDGHGLMGRYAAEFAQQILPLILNQTLSLTQQKIGQVSSYVDAVKADISYAFVETERRMIESGVNMSNSGTTASVAYLEGADLWVGTVGDSRVVLGSCETDKLKGVELSQDHRPSHPQERMRVIAAGGRVEAKRNLAGVEVGEPRLWLQDVQTPGLMVTRSLGDSIATGVGCISIPQVCFIQLKPQQDDFLVLATDGVWDVLTSQKVVEMVYTSHDAPTACKHVMQQSLGEWERKWAADNITIIVTTFHWDCPNIEEDEEDDDDYEDECMSPVTTIQPPHQFQNTPGGLKSIAEQEGY